MYILAVIFDILEHGLVLWKELAILRPFKIFESHQTSWNVRFQPFVHRRYKRRILRCAANAIRSIRGMSVRSCMFPDWFLVLPRWIYLRYREQIFISFFRCIVPNPAISSSLLEEYNFGECLLCSKVSSNVSPQLFSFPFNVLGSHQP